MYTSERIHVSAYFSIESILLEPTESFMHEGLAAKSRTRAPKNKELQLYHHPIRDGTATQSWHLAQV